MFTVKQVQRDLKTRDRYSGSIDGDAGPNTRKGMETELIARNIAIPAGPKERLLIAYQQFMLRAVGYNPGTIDGLFGPATQQAYNKYLTDRGLSSDDESVTRNVTRIFVHCAATPEGSNRSAEAIRLSHTLPKSRGGRGWSRIGYHFIILLDGTLVQTLPLNQPGIQVRGYNRNSIGICYIGGMNRDMTAAKDTRTPQQKVALAKIVKKLHVQFPNAWIGGHRDISPDLDGDGVIESHEFIKACPSFDVKSELSSWLQ